MIRLFHEDLPELGFVKKKKKKEETSND